MQKRFLWVRFTNASVNRDARLGSVKLAMLPNSRLRLREAQKPLPLGFFLVQIVALSRKTWLNP